MRTCLRRLALALAAVTTLLGASTGPASAAATEPLDRARLAASAGHGEEAVSLYDEALARDPESVAALSESAQQLSWLGRYDAAIERYDRALSLDPGNRFVLVERAKVLGWARRYDASAAAFRQLLESEPDNYDARLGLARVLSWSGSQQESRTEYQRLLAARPADPDATVGLAQTYAWSGDLDTARRIYGTAAALPGDTRSAELGIAYLDLWEGRVGRSRSAAASLRRRYPDDRDVEELQRAVRRAAAPWFATAWDVLDDSDDNRLAALRLEAGMWLPPGLRTRLTYSDYDVRSPGAVGGIRSLQLHADWKLGAGHGLEAMLGSDRFELPGRNIDDVVDWGLAWRFPLPGSWGGSLAARREPYRYSVPLIDNRIVIDSLSAGLSGPLGGKWHLAAGLSGWDLSDGNRRAGADASARHRWSRGTHTLDAGGLVRWLDWRDDPGNGYFSPAGFLAAGLLASASGPVRAASQIDYSVYAEAGLQSFDYRGERTSNDPYYLLVTRLGWQMAAAARLEIYGEAGSYASEGPEDWRYFLAGARLLWRFGVRE